MKILVTGGAGFIGSNFIHYMLASFPDVEIVNMDALTYAGNLGNLAGIDEDPRYSFFQGNIANRDEVEQVFREHSFDVIVNFAAETHVDRSIHIDTEVFIETNILGVHYLLDSCRAVGGARFVQVSTDEVYGTINSGSFSEDSPLLPNNPYAATKASADLLARTAHRTYGLDVIVTRCSNNFGPYQFPEKLIPLIISNALDNKPLPLYGNGMQIRDWIYVLDHCSALNCVIRHGKAGEIYNIGANNPIPNLEIAKKILNLLGKPDSLIKFVDDRPGHDERYSINAAKIKKELKWAPEYSFDKALDATVRWYMEHPEWLKRAKNNTYQEYYKKMYAKRLQEKEINEKDL